MTSGAVRIDVARTRTGEWVAICACGYRSEPKMSKTILAMHVRATWADHIKSVHLTPESRGEG